MPKATINGITLHYHAKGRGVPVVFIPPTLMTGEVFAYQSVQLSGAYRVITFDIRGHGNSAPSEAPLTYGLIAEDIRQLLDHLDVKKAFVCGYSVASQIALEFMLRYPDRCLGGILLSGMSEMSDLLNRARLRAAIAACASGGKPLIAGSLAWVNADSNTTFGNLYRHAMRGKLRNWRQYFAESLRYTCTDRLREIRMPVLLIYGEKDRAFRKYAAILHRELPDNEIYWVRGVRHQLPTKAPNQVSELMKSWLLRHTAEAKREREKEEAIPDMRLLEQAVISQEMELQ